MTSDTPWYISTRSILVHEGEWALVEDHLGAAKFAIVHTKCKSNGRGKQGLWYHWHLNYKELSESTDGVLKNNCCRECRLAAPEHMIEAFRVIRKLHPNGMGS